MNAPRAEPILVACRWRHGSKSTRGESGNVYRNHTRCSRSVATRQAYFALASRAKLSEEQRGSNDGPGFLIEGIADHVRNEYGVNNSVSGWVLTDEGAQYYMRGYGHAALFLMWIEDHYNASVVDGLMAAMLAHTYSEQTWVTLTAKTLNQLWNEYRPWFPTPTDQVTLFQDIH